MQEATETLPKDPALLKKLTLSLLSENKHLKQLVAKLKRRQFGRSSESLNIDQLFLLLDKEVTDEILVMPKRQISSLVKRKPSRKPLPAHLPREEHIHAINNDACEHCGGHLQLIGEDVSEMLEYIPARFKVIRHVRPKLACKCCNQLIQAPAPDRPIPQGIAGPDLLAQVLVSKYCDHLPLYRQNRMYAREGVDLPRSTLADWVGKASTLLLPLVEAIQRHTLGGETVHADDTPIPVLDPGKGRTKTGRLWTYVRDERPRQGQAPPAVWFSYTSDRKGKHPQDHLKAFKGIVHADGYAGFNALFEAGGCIEAACMAHDWRKFYDIHIAQSSPKAIQALEYIRQLYQVESVIRGKPPDERRKHRQDAAALILRRFKAWLEVTLIAISRKSELAKAIRYALVRWVSLTRYCDDGRIEIDNNAAERSLRTVTLGLKNYLFVGSGKGGERAAARYSLIGTADLNGLNAMNYLRHVLSIIGSHPINKIDELLPWNIQETARCAIDTQEAA